MIAGNEAKAFNWMKRPVPFADESLAGYLGRWARENVMGSRKDLLNAIGISRAIRLFPADLEKLATALGIELSVLESIAPSSEPARPVLRRSYTRPDSEAVCPQCLSDASYSRQLWSHCLATACPTHGTRLIDRCQHFNCNFLHDRPLSHRCGCGADLRLQTSVKATPAEVEFASLLLGQCSTPEIFPLFLNHGIPKELDLYFWGLANHFGSSSGGRSLVKAGKLPIPKSVEEAVIGLNPLFELFEDWPNRFDARLKQMMEVSSVGGSTGVAAKLGRWYFFLFRTYKHDAFNPIRVAAANRIVQSNDGLQNARTHCVQGIATVQKNWFSVKEASAELNVSVDRINDGIDRCLIKGRVYDDAVSYRQRFVSLNEITRLKQAQFEHISDVDARSLLNVPEAVYKLMCQAGWIILSDKNDVAPVVSGFIQHKPLLSLIEKLRTLAQANKDRKIVASVPLRQLNFRRTTNLQRLISLFRAIAAGELTPVDHDESLSIGGMLFAQDEVDQRIASWFVDRGLTIQQVSRMTGAHYDAVRIWVEKKLLPATREPLEQGAPWVIDLQDYVTFSQTYAPLASHAKACNSSSRGLVKRLQAIGVTPITFEGEERGTLVRLADVFNSLKAVNLKQPECIDEVSLHEPS